MEHLSVMGVSKKTEIIIDIKRINQLLTVTLVCIFVLSILIERFFKIDSFTKYIVMLELFVWLFILMLIKHLLIFKNSSKAIDKKDFESSEAKKVKILEKYLQVLELLTIFVFFAFWIKACELIIFELISTSTYILLTFILIFFVLSLIEFVIQMLILQKSGEIRWHRYRGISNIVSTKEILFKKHYYTSSFILKTYVSFSAYIILMEIFFDTMQNTITVTNWILVVGLLTYLIYEFLLKCRNVH